MRLRGITLATWEDDLVELLKVSEKFAMESGIGGSFDFDICCKYLYNWVADPDSHILAVFDEKGEGEDSPEIVAFAIVTVSYEFTTTPFGYVAKFYVAPHVRKTPVARSLTDHIVTWFDVRGVSYSFVTATAEVGENKFFENLMAKFGYAPAGRMLRRKHGED
jgi:GNAT superfamily N-acetyltransferase